MNRMISAFRRSAPLLEPPSAALQTRRGTLRRRSARPYRAPRRAFLSSPSATSPRTMRCASPSTMAVLPTPGSPISTGLFLVRRESTWITRRISSSRPITGSSFALRGHLRQIAAVFFQGLVGRLRILGGHPLAAPDFLQRPHQTFARHSEFAEQLSRRARIIGQRQQHMLHRHILVLQPLGLLFRPGSAAWKPGGDVDLIRSSGRAGNFGQPVQLPAAPAPASCPLGHRALLRIDGASPPSCSSRASSRWSDLNCWFPCEQQWIERPGPLPAFFQ